MTMNPCPSSPGRVALRTSLGAAASAGDSAGRNGTGDGPATIPAARSAASTWPAVALAALDRNGVGLVDDPGSAGVDAAMPQPALDRANTSSDAVAATSRAPTPPRAWDASSGRPRHRPPAEQVDVEMVDGLAAPRPDVDDQPIAVRRDALVPGEVGRGREQPSEQRAVRVRSGRPPRGCGPGA